VGSANRLHPGLGQAEVFHLPFADQLLHSPGHIYDWHVGIDAVLVQQVDAVGSEPPQRCLDNLANVFGPTIQTKLLLGVRINLEAELGGNDDPVADRDQCLTDQLFIREWAVHFSRVEEGDAVIHRRTDERDAVLFVDGWAVTGTQTHAPQAEGRYGEASPSERACLHGCSFAG
jgi:hypothetical protein